MRGVPSVEPDPEWSPAVSKIPIDLPPDPYPATQRRAARRGGNAVLFVGVFAAVFALVWMMLEIF